MNGRVRAIGSGLLVGATSVALVGAAAAADGAPTRRAPARAGAAAGAGRSAALHVAASAAFPIVDPGLRAKNDQVVIRRFTEAVNAQRWYAWASATLEREHAAAMARASRRPAASSYRGGSFLECVKYRESRGQYDVVNSSSGAAGAYQFMPGTWNTNAAAAGRPDLVGVNPADASAADQDAMAQHLYATQGARPWGGGCG